MIDYMELSDAAFNKAVDALSSSAYRKLVEASEDFRDRINNNPAWMERRDQRALEEYVTKDLQAKKDRLNAELRAGKGLTQATWVWLDERNIPTVSLSVMPALKEIKPAYLKLDAKVGPFTEEERGVLLTVAQQCCGIGRVLDLRDIRSWDCAYHIAISSGKIGLSRTQPEVKHEPTMAENIRGMVAEPTAADRRRAYANDIVWSSRSLGRDLTEADINKLLGDDYKKIVAEGYSADGKILVHTNDLSRRGGR
jgi:hypothetical protein